MLRVDVGCIYILIFCFLVNGVEYSETGDDNSPNTSFVNVQFFQGPREFVRAVRCQYCYQTEKWEHKCELSPNCKSADSPRKYYLTNCTVRSAVVCLGNRVFQKKQLCNWTSGYHWRTTLILSIMLGGFGVDRFYLGYWQEGLGKFFSFGGLGVWTLIDVILIGLHYLGPADGSLYL
ncbi:TM2 domain-containing protein almondex isoform X2 [Bacillus rossius redtenbacheri]|uniref:TM2 domain-containing protein almondex isoform X2 n=1 Tax=Bacillus rossius redtenbacheri TaxID=93214 RepID=UPI002FDC96A8